MERIGTQSTLFLVVSATLFLLLTVLQKKSFQLSHLCDNICYTMLFSRNESVTIYLAVVLTKHSNYMSEYYSRLI